MTGYEQQLATSLRDHGITLPDNASCTYVAKGLGYNIKYAKLKWGVEATLEQCTITINNALGEKSQNFCLAHELAHILRGQSSNLQETRLTHSPIKPRPDEE